MTAPRKPVAWLCVSEDGFAADAAISESQRDTYARMRRAIHPLYLETDLQPLWALVEKYGQWSDERQAKADRHNDNGDAAAAEFDSGMAEAYSRVADELKSALEAMQ